MQLIVRMTNAVADPVINKNADIFTSNLSSIVLIKGMIILKSIKSWNVTKIRDGAWSASERRGK